VETKTMYILKIKGKAKIPDYIQLRDDNFTLKAYFRVDRPDKTLNKYGYSETELDKILKIIIELPFGVVTKLVL
jgi:uncharacterized protein YecE (DUF72 family)